MKSIRPIEPYVKKNFRTLCDAVTADRICLMSVYDASLGKPATVICAVNYHDHESNPYELVPLATMVDCDPYSRFVTPLEEYGGANE